MRLMSLMRLAPGARHSWKPGAPLPGKKPFLARIGLRGPCHKAPRPFLARLASRRTEHEPREINAGVTVPFDDVPAFQPASMRHMLLLRYSHNMSM